MDREKERIKRQTQFDSPKRKDKKDKRRPTTQFQKEKQKARLTNRQIFIDRWTNRQIFNDKWTKIDF